MIMYFQQNTCPLCMCVWLVKCRNAFESDVRTKCTAQKATFSSLSLVNWMDSHCTRLGFVYAMHMILHVCMLYNDVSIIIYRIKSIWYHISQKYHGSASLCPCASQHIPTSNIQHHLSSIHLISISPFFCPANYHYNSKRTFSFN